MRARPNHLSALFPATLMLLTLASACGSKKPTDWKNRAIAWKFGPTSGGATFEHLTGTGTKGAGPIAEGWKILLSDGNKLEIKPAQLAKDHKLLGKVKMNVGLFNKAHKKIETFRTDVLTAENSTFSFAIKEDAAKQIWDAVIWFVKA